MARIPSGLSHAIHLARKGSYSSFRSENPSPSANCSPLRRPVVSPQPTPRKPLCLQPTQEYLLRAFVKIRHPARVSKGPVGTSSYVLEQYAAAWVGGWSMPVDFAQRVPAYLRLSTQPVAGCCLNLQCMYVCMLLTRV